MTDLFNQSSYTPKNQSVVSLIQAYEKNYQPLFSKIKKDWNQRIRDFLRDSTGLKLSFRGNAIVTGREIVSIDIKPDYQDYFVKQIDEAFPELNFNEYQHLRQLLMRLDKSIQFFDQKQPYFWDLRNYCIAYIKKYNMEDFIRKMFYQISQNRDILGSYFYSESRVEVYYLPLIFLSKVSDFSLEYAFVIVLAHELAHAYHHVGKDNDNLTWVHMPQAEIAVKEGLAQYYTYQFIQEYKFGYPQLEKTFDQMIKFQTGPYRVFENWLNYKKEAVKTAMILSRLEYNVKLAQFEKTLLDMDKKLTHQK